NPRFLIAAFVLTINCCYSSGIIVIAFVEAFLRMLPLVKRCSSFTFSGMSWMYDTSFGPLRAMVRKHIVAIVLAFEFLNGMLAKDSRTNNESLEARNPLQGVSYTLLAVPRILTTNKIIINIFIYLLSFVCLCCRYGLRMDELTIKLPTHAIKVNSSLRCNLNPVSSFSDKLPVTSRLFVFFIPYFSSPVVYILAYNFYEKDTILIKSKSVDMLSSAVALALSESAVVCVCVFVSGVCFESVCFSLPTDIRHESFHK
ncbi:hypothetical protein L9F63_011333, partial [Diploptera punctata]